MPPSESPKRIGIVMADDDQEDREFAREAFEESRLSNDFRTVADGVELPRKPVTFEGLLEAIRAMRRYWLEIVELPRDNPNG